MHLCLWINNIDCYIVSTDDLMMATDFEFVNTDCLTVHTICKLSIDTHVFILS